MEDTLQKNIKYFVEQELRRYRHDKKFLESYHQEKENIIEEMQSPQGNTDDRITNSKISNPTSTKVFRIMAMEQKADRAAWYTKAIDDTLDELQDMEKKMITLYYFDGYLTVEGVCRNLFIGRKQFYERKADIIKKLALRMGLL